MTTLHRCLVLVALLLLVLSPTGCLPNAGGDDVELTYEVDGPPPPGESLRVAVLRRLSAGRVSADVVAGDGEVRVVADESLTTTIDSLLLWQQDLFLYPIDEPATAPFEGTREEVRRQISLLPSARDMRAFAEPIWESADGVRPERWRMRVVRSEPIGELGEGALVGWGDRGALRIRGAAGSPAERTLARARGGDVVAVRGDTSLGRVSFVDGGAILSLGSGLAIYARTQRELQVLTAPWLPPLRRTGAVGLPPNTILTAACVILPIVLSLAWLAFVRRFDRAHPEPMWLVLVTFALGAVATVPAALIEHELIHLTPLLDPDVASFGGRAFGLPSALLVYTIVVGLVEEASKLAAAAYAARRREFDEPVDGIVYGIVASLGFAAAENVHFFATTRLAVPVVIARSFMSVPAHMFFGAIWGYALGRRLVDSRKHMFRWFFVAAALHGAFDALLGADGGATLAVALNVGLASVFVVLVQRALRHGIVEDAARAVKPEDRVLFRVGRPRTFWASAAALHAVAFGIFMLGAAYQLTRHRASLGFVLGSAVLLALLALAAFGVSAALPLDVAIDAYGVTFAGAARPWKKIRGYSIVRSHVEVDCEAGPLLLGPAPPAVLDAIVAALRDHLTPSGGAREVTLESR